MKQKWTSDKSLLLSRTLTVVVLVLAAAMLFCIPIITEWYDAVSGQEPIRLVLNIALYLSDLIGIAAVFMLYKMLRNIAREQVFVEANVHCFRIISWCCFAIAVIWLVLTSAVELREEHDYTI